MAIPSDEILATEVATGRQRELMPAAYVSRDGRLMIPVLTAAAIWIDPRDAGECHSTLPGPVMPRPGGIGLRTLLQSVPAGAAAPRAIELTLFGSEEKPDSAPKE